MPEMPWAKLPYLLLAKMDEVKKLPCCLSKVELMSILNFYIINSKNEWILTGPHACSWQNTGLDGKKWREPCVSRATGASKRPRGQEPRQPRAKQARAAFWPEKPRQRKEYTAKVSNMHYWNLSFRYYTLVLVFNNSRGINWRQQNWHIFLQNDFLSLQQGIKWIKW